MDIEKLKETLLANGIDEETADKVIDDLEKPEDETPEDEDEGKPEEELPPSNEDDDGEDESNGDDEDGANEEGELPPDETVPPVQEEVPPVEVPQEMPVEEPIPQELPPEVPPVEEQPLPPAPEFDPTELLGKIDEQKATIDGLLARVDSLEQALKQVGVLDASDGEEVGVDNPNVPPSNPGAIDEFDDALAVLNGKKHY